MKRLLLMSSFFSIFFIHSAICAQQFVIDEAAIAKAVEQLEQLKQQYDELKKETKQLQQTYSAITGTRGFGEVLKNESFKDNLPENWSAVYNNLRQQGYTGLTPQAKEIYDRNKIYDKCQSIASSEQKKVCAARSVKAAQDEAFTLDMLEKSKSKMANIENLLGQIRQTQDPKGIAELQARIATEQSLIANDQTKLQLFKMASEAEERVLNQQAREAAAKSAATHARLALTPIDFDS